MATPAATYNEALTDPVHVARLYATDTNVADYIHSDAEYRRFLLEAGGNPVLAAAYALRNAAADAAKVAVVMKTQETVTDPTKMPGILRDLANDLETQAQSSAAGQEAYLASIRTPDRVFVPDYDQGRSPGTMDGW